MRLIPLSFDQLTGWSAENLLDAWPPFLKSCAALIERRAPLRIAKAPGDMQIAIARLALQLEIESPDTKAASALMDFFQTNFQPVLVEPDDGSRGFVTGYYEPEVPCSPVETMEFSAPVLQRPDDLIDMRGVAAPGWDARFEGAQRGANGILGPYPARAAIESGVVADHTRPIVWLRDPVELFLVQVQGSARVVFPDGRQARLIYAGRNGRPYTSIGRILVEQGAIPMAEMSLARLKAWLRENGQKPGDAGRAIMQRNESYIFFKLDPEPDLALGPIGAQGVPLTPLRSLAVDRTLWPYGTPFWVYADLPEINMSLADVGRLMIAQDTGSAIVGPARGDLFIGSGEKAGAIAGNIRHTARFVAFTPKQTAP